MRKNISGFTIVELLIVIVVIAILATISVVAYNGIQERANLTKMKSDFASIEKAIEIHRTTEGGWPLCQGIEGNGCNIDNIAEQLDSNIPTRTGNNQAIGYVADNGQNRWSVRFTHPDGTSCKMGRNMASSWWLSAPSCW